MKNFNYITKMFVILVLVTIINRLIMSFEIILQQKPAAALWRSESPTTSAKAARLQELFDMGLGAQYDSEKAEMEKQGAMFRLTKSQVFEIFPSEKTMEVPIKFQVKGSTLTWSFLSPMDETHQEFRDELYQSAAVGHLAVKDHCEKYWRGTNSLHVKKMHTNEAESGYNHNHYRIKDDRDATPIDISQHLTGLVQAQREMGLMVQGKGGLREKFLDLNEAAEISHKFSVRWAQINHVGPAKTLTIGGEVVNLPERAESIVSEYRRDPSQLFTKEDEIEWAQNKGKEQPCATISPTLPIVEKLEAVKVVGMLRGMGSEFAQTRQLAGSAYKVSATVVEREDKVKVKESNPAPVQQQAV